LIDDLVLARAAHVLALVHWIGGVGFVSLVVLPIAIARPSAAEGLALFDSVERRFAAQVRFSIPIAGLAGLWMTYRMDLWDRFADPHFWWMAAMFGLWATFMLVVFVLEPLLNDRIEAFARKNPEIALARLLRLHIGLLGFAVLTVLGAVAGSHGVYF
jgi:uncharacterized membrane protein